MSTLGPPTASQRRAALLEQLIVTLTTGSGTGEALAIKDRDPDDLTIALLDAWATAGDVIGFYLDRIAAEGYISSATEPGSILALASLLGHSPQLSIAASAPIAYQLQPDPADTAVVLPAGLLVQSVPAAGQIAQTFQTTAPLLARPSWGLLKPKSTRPLMSGDLVGPQPSIVIAGTTANLKPNQVVLVAAADPPSSVPTQTPYTVVSATPNAAANTTTVQLLALQDTVVAARTPDAGPTDVESSVDLMMRNGLGKTATPPPSSVNQLNRATGDVFGFSRDSTLRILSALQPSVSTQLYQTAASNPLGLAAITGVSACQVQATPFGAQAPPRMLSAGPPAVTQDWPIGATSTLTVGIDEQDFNELITNDPPARTPSASIQIAESGRTQSAELVVPVVASAAPSASQTLGDGTVSVGLSTLANDNGNSLVVDYAGGQDSDTTAFTLTVEILYGGPVKLTLSDYPAAPYTWDPVTQATVQTTIGTHQVSIEWNNVAATIQVVTPLALKGASQDLLVLDTVYPGILPGSSIVVQRTFADGTTPTPLVLTVASVSTLSVSAYGITGKATQLQLNGPWLVTQSGEPDSNTTQAALREITVSAQPTPLQPLPVPFVPPDGTIDGSSVELSTLIAGMDAGRLIAVTGQRADLLPAVVNGGELAMVAGLQPGANLIAGDTPTTTLVLQAPLAFSYVPSTVQIYGNVVRGEQGATITDVLGSGNPAVTFPTFTLSSGPLLSDPSSTGVGSTSSLTVTVSGVVYTEVSRLTSAGPPRSYVTGTDRTGKTTVTFATPLPAGTSNVIASYRVGDGSQGNLVAGQLTTLLSRPAATQSVANPLPATGGAGSAQPADVVAAAPIGLRGLGRLVSINDFADLAQSLAGVASASARLVRDRDRPAVLVTAAGPDPTPIDPGIITALQAQMTARADPAIQVKVAAASLYMIVLAATVTPAPTADWDGVADAVRAALTQAFAYPNRGLGQPVSLGDLIAGAHSVPAVLSFDATALALVPATTTATALATALPALLKDAPTQPGLTIVQGARDWSTASQTPMPSGVYVPDAIAFISASVPDTLLLSEAT